MARPRTYNSVDELEAVANAYMEENKGKPTITGLALALGFESRQSFYDYEKDSEFSYTIKRLRLSVESEYEKRLFENACTGAIFALKNFGWTDKTEVEHSGDMSINWKETKNYGADNKTDEGS